MAELTLVVGDKNKSSWSLRPYLALAATGAPFQEVVVRLDKPDTAAQIAKWSPSGRVPLLKDGGLAIWDSLAICEYLAEKFPRAQLWPADAEARAVARSVSAEMHSGFADLRRICPMKVAERLPTPQLTPGVKADVERIFALWKSCRAAYGKGGPFLFGQFTIADAMYAPVVTRFVTYGIEADPASREYMDAIAALPAMRRWTADAEKELSGA